MAIDLAPAYTEPTAEQVMRNSPTEQQMDLMRRHGDNDILYRLSNFEVSSNLEIIEPDGHLETGDKESDAADIEAPGDEESLIQ